MNNAPLENLREDINDKISAALLTSHDLGRLSVAADESARYKAGWNDAADAVMACARGIHKKCILIRSDLGDQAKKIDDALEFVRSQGDKGFVSGFQVACQVIKNRVESGDLESPVTSHQPENTQSAKLALDAIRAKIEAHQASSKTELIALPPNWTFTARPEKQEPDKIMEWKYPLGNQQRLQELKQIAQEGFPDYRHIFIGATEGLSDGPKITIDHGAEGYVSRDQAAVESQAAFERGFLEGSKFREDREIQGNPGPDNPGNGSPKTPVNACDGSTEFTDNFGDTFWMREDFSFGRFMCGTYNKKEDEDGVTVAIDIYMARDMLIWIQNFLLAQENNKR